jgi:MYXO-CTERM domain-containing protein
VLQRLLSARPYLAATLGALALFGCGSAEQFDLERAPIVNGERSVATDDDVVQLTSHAVGATPQACSGTLVAPNIVLTALHCVANFSGGDFSCNSDGTLQTSNAGGGMLGELVDPAQIDIRVGVFPATAVDAHAVKLFGTGTNQICRNDLALVVLDRDLDLPLSALRLQRGVELGEKTRVVGYGASENAATEGRFARAGMRIIDRGVDAGGSNTNIAAPRTVVVGQGPCHGDSGGPLFSEETGALIGVYSLVSGASCTAVGVRNVYTRLEPFADLVQSAFDFAAQTPIMEPGADDAGVGGQAAGGDSASGGNAPVSGGGTSLVGASSAGAGARPGGSGSSQDGSCACRAGLSQPRRPLTLGALALIAVLFGRRRRRALRTR